MTLNVLLYECFRHFYGLDHSNAAVHTAAVRYSPITFRLAEHLVHYGFAEDEWVIDVMTHAGTYLEDRGR